MMSSLISNSVQTFIVSSNGLIVKSEPFLMMPWTSKILLYNIIGTDENLEKIFWISNNIIQRGSNLSMASLDANYFCGNRNIKVGLSPFKICFIYFNKNPLKIIKKVF